MQPIIVSDTSCLILFHKIRELELLQKLFGRITVTETVATEFRKPLPVWVQMQNPIALHKSLLGFLDAGEATSIALALENAGSLLIIDELKGRKVAKEMGIAITGSLGILITAKNKGLVKAIKPLLEKVKQTNFRLSDDLIKKTLIQTNEF